MASMRLILHTVIGPIGIWVPDKTVLDVNVDANAIAKADACDDAIAIGV